MTTGCDVLWSGVPLVSLAGEKMVSRMGNLLTPKPQTPNPSPDPKPYTLHPEHYALNPK